MFRLLFHIFTLVLLVVPESYAARKIHRSRNNKPVIIKVIAFERNSKIPVYRGPVSIIGFSGTQKGETNAEGVFQAEFPGNDTVAISIKGATGYRDTTTKSTKIKNKQKVINVQMRRNNKEEPLHPPTPTPKPQPTSKPNPTNTNKPPTVFTPRPPTLPTLQPPLPPYDPPVPSRPPVITKHPQSYSIAQNGQRVQLSVTATGTGSLTYQWKMNGSPISTARSPIYNFAVPFSLSTTARSFRFTCVVSNAYGSVESNGAVVNVLRTF